MIHKRFTDSSIQHSIIFQGKKQKKKNTFTSNILYIR